MVKIHAHYINCIFTSFFRRVLTATRRTLFYLTTSKLTSSQTALCLAQQVRHPSCTTCHKSERRSSLNILFTVFFKFSQLGCLIPFRQSHVGFRPNSYKPGLIDLLILDKKIVSGFYFILGVWRPSWSCDPDATYHVS